MYVTCTVRLYACVYNINRNKKKEKKEKKKKMVRTLS